MKRALPLVSCMILAGCGSQTETPANAPAAPANAGNAGGPPGGPPNAAEGMERMRGNVPDISSMRDAMQNMAAMRGGPGGGGADAAILDDETGPHAEGKKVFKAQGCTRCHSVSAAGGRGGFGPMAGGPGGFPGGFPGRGRPGAEQAGDAAPGGEAGPGAGGPPGGGPPGGGLPGGGRPGFGGRGGMGGMMGMGRGPNLSKVGANPDHTVEWLSAHIRDPKTHNPQSRMPAYEGKISDDDLQALAEFLASLTGEEAEEAGQGQDKAE